MDKDRFKRNLRTDPRRFHLRRKNRLCKSAHERDMGYWTLAVIGDTSDGRAGFIILASRDARAESLEDHSSCPNREVHSIFAVNDVANSSALQGF